MNGLARARPLLGTVVSIRVLDAHAHAHSHAAIDAAFEAVALIDQLMSFQRSGSELSQLNQHAHQHAVQVHAHTYRVLRWSHRLAAHSAGVFDVARAQRDARHVGSWRDLQLLPQQQVRFLRPMRLDLSGIAKGYAVDVAIGMLRRYGVRRALVNAGGDLRLVGGCEPVTLRTQSRARHQAVIELADAALATSDGADGVTATVAARRCVLADALTKAVIAAPASAGALLRQYGARGWLHRPALGWHTVH